MATTSKRVSAKKISVTKKPVKKVEESLPPKRQTFKEFVRQEQEAINKNGEISRNPHHPDYHALGMSPQCDLCDTSKDSLASLYEMPGHLRG